MGFTWDAGCECGWFAHGRGESRKDADWRARQVFERHQIEAHGRSLAQLRERKLATPKSHKA